MTWQAVFVYCQVVIGGKLLSIVGPCCDGRAAVVVAGEEFLLRHR